MITDIPKLVKIFFVRWVDFFIKIAYNTIKGMSNMRLYATPKRAVHRVAACLFFILDNFSLLAQLFSYPHYVFYILIIYSF